MAHERGDVRTAGVLPGHDASAEELQRLLRAKRESITQTVEEIKMTMHSGYQDTKDKVSQTFDWRYQLQRYPLAAVGGALAIGFLAGQILGRGMTSGSRGISGMRRRSMTGTASNFGAGTSMAPQTHVAGISATSIQHEHREPRHFIPQSVKSRVSGRFEETLSDLAEHLLGEVTRVGRDIIIPTVIGHLTNTFTHEHSGGMGSQERSYSPKSTTESSGFSGSTGAHGTAAGGPISQSGEDQGSRSNRFQGRGI